MLQVEGVEEDKDLLQALIENKGIIDKYFDYTDFIKDALIFDTRKDLLELVDELEEYRKRKVTAQDNLQTLLSNRQKNQKKETLEMEEDKNEMEEEDGGIYI